MILNQPFSSTFGDEIISKLSQVSNAGDRHIWIIVAYAKISGIRRLMPSLSNFSSTGGKIHAIIGIDQKNTSFEALKIMHEICDDLFIYHSSSPSITFHTKAYSIKDNSYYWSAIGSNNLTAGGLYDNIECCVIAENNSSVEELYNFLSSTEYLSCKRVDLDLIELLLKEGYIKTEKQILSEFRSSMRKVKKGIAIFGRDSRLLFKESPVRKNHDGIITEVEEEVNDSAFLIKYVPKAGNRSKQVHFTLDILRNYFKKDKGGSIKIQQVIDMYHSLEIENRHIILSDINKNVKIEINGAESLNHNYPDSPHRPILIFKRINEDFYEYMLILPGHEGYEILERHLDSIPWKSKSLQYEIVNSDDLYELWQDCPLL